MASTGSSLWHTVLKSQCIRGGRSGFVPQTMRYKLRFWSSSTKGPQGNGDRGFPRQAGGMSGYHSV